MNKILIFLFITCSMLLCSVEQKNVNQSTVKQLYVLDHKFLVGNFLFDRIGNRLITASHSLVWHIAIFNLNNGLLLHTFDAASGDMQLSPDGKILMIDTALYSMESYEKLYEYKNPYEYIVGKRFISNTQIAIAGGVGSNICVTQFDITTKKMTSLGCKEVVHYRDYIWSPQNTYFAMTTYEGKGENQKFLCWNLKTNKYYEIKDIAVAHFNANDTKIALLKKAPAPYTTKDKLIIADAATGQPLQNYEFQRISNITWGTNLLGITQYTDQNTGKTLIIDTKQNKQLCTVPIYASSIDKSDKLMSGKDIPIGINYLFDPLTCNVLFNTHDLSKENFKKEYVHSLRREFAEIWVRLKSQEQSLSKDSLNEMEKIKIEIRKAKSVNEIHYSQEKLKQILPENMYKKYVESEDLFSQKTYDDLFNAFESTLPYPETSYPYSVFIIRTQVCVYKVE